MMEGMDRPIASGKKRRRAIVIGAVLAVLALVVVAATLRPRGAALRTSAERVVIQTVMEGPFQEFIPVNGSVVPVENLFLDAVEGGRVEALYVEAGARVSEGDPILKLSNTNLLLDIMWREAELFQQSNNLRNTALLMEQTRLDLSRKIADIDNRMRQQQRTLRRTEELARHGLVAQHTLELARDELEHLERDRELATESQRTELEFRANQVSALEASLARMQENLAVVKGKQEELTLRAPVAGHLTALDAEVGQLKTPGQRLGQIDVLSGFLVRASLDEYYIDRVHVGCRGHFEHRGARHDVVVDKVFPEVREGRFEVELGFAGPPPEGVRRGQRLRTRLELGEMETATLLPRGAFFQSTGGAWAYVVEGDASVAVRRPIKLGRQNPEVFEVVEGLAVGERVITSSYEGFGDVERVILD